MRSLDYRQIYHSLLAADKSTKVKAALILLAGLICIIIMLSVS